jgi:MtN3 and saliva related transmembrane protein
MHIPLDAIGYAAALLTTGAFVPQALHTFRTRDVAGISLGMYCVFTLGILLWLVYGLLIRNWPMTLANVVTFTLASGILWMKIRYGGQKPPQD